MIRVKVNGCKVGMMIKYGKGQVLAVLTGSRLSRLCERKKEAKRWIKKMVKRTSFA